MISTTILSSGHALSGHFNELLEHNPLVFNAVVVALCVLIGALLLHKRERRKWLMDNLKYCALTVFVAGVLLYCVGFWWEGTRGNVLATVLRSIVASMEMFVSESELIEVRHECKNDLLYMLIFSTVHFLAICVSAAFIIHIIGIRARSYLLMRFARRKRRDAYIFFDVSPESIALAKDIVAEKARGGVENFQIVFVRTPLMESHTERFSFSHLLNGTGGGHDGIEELVEMNAYLVFSRSNVTADMNEERWRKGVGLGILDRYIDKCDGNLSFFCMSKNEESNVNTAVVLHQRYANRTGKEVNVYCRSCRDSITDTYASHDLKMVDAANLAVMELKKRVECQPVSYVRPDIRLAAATKPFTALIVGFGQTGMEVLKFLYEFGLFVRPDGSNNAFVCHIVDPKADHLENQFYMDCPAFRSSGLVHFIKGTVESNCVEVEKLVSGGLDYAVVCTDDDKRNLEIGISLLTMAHKRRRADSKLGIFMAIYDDDIYAKAADIARFYDERGRTDLDHTEFNFSLEPFGNMSQLFTCGNIIREEALNRAKTFYFEYMKTGGLLETDFEQQGATNKETEWQLRRKKLAKAGAEMLSLKNKIAQQESQDMANVWHVKTKMALIGALPIDAQPSAEEAAKRREEVFACLDAVMNALLTATATARREGGQLNGTHQLLLDEIAKHEAQHGLEPGTMSRLMENLARGEHLRWVATNATLGYRKPDSAQGNSKNYIRKTHACMVSYEGLLQVEALRETIKYDYNTIWVSMKSQMDKQ